MSRRHKGSRQRAGGAGGFRRVGGVLAFMRLKCAPACPPGRTLFLFCCFCGGKGRSAKGYNPPGRYTRCWAPPRVPSYTGRAVVHMDAATANRERSRARLHDLGVAGLWEHFLLGTQMGQGGKHTRSFSQQTLPLFSAAPAPSLGHYLAVWKRWKAWAISGQRGPASPTAMGMVLWLRQAAKGGPTVARGLLSARRWLQDFVGINFGAYSTVLRLRA